MKALIGGLGVGALGFFGSDLIFGIGHEGVELALQGEMALGLMLGLVVLKILATSVTLGAGGSGGVFAPALFIGAMAGGAFGKVANQFLPSLTAPPGAYALVGMAALFAAAAHAPITGIIILFEMTDNYRIILPLMFAVVVAHLMASAIYHDSIYSIKLRRKGALSAPQQEMGILDLLSGDGCHVLRVRDGFARAFPGRHDRGGPGGKGPELAGHESRESACLASSRRRTSSRPSFPGGRRARRSGTS